MKAVILITEPSSHLNSLCASKPLSLHSFAGKSLISRQISSLFSLGADSVTVVSASDRGISGEISKQKKFGLNVSFIRCGSKSPLSFICDYSDDIFGKDEQIVIYEGDRVIPDTALAEMLENHAELSADVSVLLGEAKKGDAVFSLSCLNRIEGVFSPPSVDYGYSDLAYSGGVVIPVSLLARASGRNPEKFSDDVMPVLIGHNSVYGYLPKEEAIILSSPADYRRAASYFVSLYGKNGIFRDDNSKICEGTAVKPFLQLGKGSVIGKGCSISESVIGDGVQIGENCELDGTVVGDTAVLENGCRLCRDSVIGIGAKVAEGFEIKKEVTVPDFRAVGDTENEFEKFGFSDSESYEAGKKAGKAHRKIAVGWYGGDEARRGANLFADGAASEGADVYITENMPLSVWRFAANRTGAGCGAFISDSMPVFCAECGNDGFPNLERSDGKKKRNGEKHFLPSVFALYSEEARRNMPHGFAASVSSFDGCLLSLFRDTLFDKPSKDGICFFLDENGSDFSLSDEKGIYRDEAECLQISVFAALYTDGICFIPESLPLADRLLEKATGGKIVRVPSEDGYSARFAVSMLDAAFKISKIAAALQKSGKPLFAFCDAVPKYCLKSVLMPIASCRKHIMRLFSTEAAADGKPSRPFLQNGKGGIFAKISARKSAVTVTAVADSETVCDELLSEIKG